MGSALKKLKKAKGKASPSPLDPMILEAWNRGFNAGAKEQRESDINNLVKMLEGLETMPGIGMKTADKVRELIMKQFGA